MSSEELNSQKIFDAALRTIHQLIDGYEGNVPLVRYLKDNFRSNRKYGSRDRKLYTAWAFCWYRFGKNLTELSFNERITLAWYICHGWNTDISRYFALQYLTHKDQLPNAGDPHERLKHLQLCYPAFDVKLLFPFEAPLSDKISTEAFCFSHVLQPLVWTRPFPGFREKIMDAAISQQLHLVVKDAPTFAIGFPPGFNIENLPFTKGNHYEIQDLSSQLCGLQIPASSNQHWWDCCCGAGGKSLQLLQRVPAVKIHATDIRKSILENFKERLPASFKRQVTFAVADLAASNEKQPNVFYDGIIADVPCSGSGTWARTPEYLTHFKEEELLSFRSRQEKIVLNALPHMKSGGFFVYMTCSVFKLENEGMVDFILQHTSLKLIQNETVCGFNDLADSMFYAIFKKD